MDNAKKLREQSAQELESQIGDLNASMYSLRCENNVQRKLEKPHLIKETRRQKARILTILREKENEAAK